MNFGICVGHQEEGSSFEGNSRSKGFSRCFFLKELPGLSPDKEIEFGIDVPQLF